MSTPYYTSLYRICRSVEVHFPKAEALVLPRLKWSLKIRRPSENSAAGSSGVRKQHGSAQRGLNHKAGDELRYWR